MEKENKITGREDQNPWTKWYWADYAADIGIASCGLAAQGLWMRMLSIMARSKNKGFLLDGDKQMTSKTLAKLTGESHKIVQSLLNELNIHGVYSITANGIIFNRRMARESELSKIRSECGRLGGLSKKHKGSKSESKAKAPSASASASASEIIKYLNEKTGKAFQPDSKGTVAFIKARLAEGRTVEDFKKVIDTKTSKWKDKTWTDKRTGEVCQGNDFLRPSTLFRPDNFEAYLNEGPATASEGGWAKKMEAKLKADREAEDKS